MRVIEATRFGGPEVLTVQDVPEAVAAAGQVVVDVSAADVLFLDTQLRRGWGATTSPSRPRTFPAAASPAT